MAALSENEIFLRLGIALLLGLLIGLQREQQHSELAGLRTFALVSLFGALSGMLAGPFGLWFPAAGLLAVAAAVGVANFLGSGGSGQHPRTTTEIALLLTYAIGLYLMQGSLSIALALGGTVAVVLYAKQPFRDFFSKFRAADLRALIQFVLIALVILPLLPDQTYGPYDVLNPHEAWLMVVLIVGISLGGYLIYQIAGPSAGMLLGGLLGGLISSTATTVSFARQTAGRKTVVAPAAFVIAAASTVVYGRLLIEIAVVAPEQLRSMGPPLFAMLLLGLLLAALAFFAARNADQAAAPVEQENPAQLQAAIVFGLLYVGVLLTVAFARDRFGDSGVYLVAIISGLTDVDAITLSTTRLVDAGQLSFSTGWRTVLLASLANLGFKFGAVVLLGHPELRKRFGVYTGVMFAVGLPILFFWPD